jgi:hypothetical protein
MSAIELFRSAGDEEEAAHLLLRVASCALGQGDVERARRLVTESLERGGRRGEDDAIALSLLSKAAFTEGDVDVFRSVAPRYHVMPGPFRGGRGVVCEPRTFFAASAAPQRVPARTGSARRAAMTAPVTNAAGTLTRSRMDHSALTASA